MPCRKTISTVCKPFFLDLVYMLIITVDLLSQSQPLLQSTTEPHPQNSVYFDTATLLPIDELLGTQSPTENSHTPYTVALADIPQDVWLAESYRRNNSSGQSDTCERRRCRPVAPCYERTDASGPQLRVRKRRSGGGNLLCVGSKIVPELSPAPIPPSEARNITLLVSVAFEFMLQSLTSDFRSVN